MCKAPSYILIYYQITNHHVNMHGMEFPDLCFERKSLWARHIFEKIQRLWILVQCATESLTVQTTIEVAAFEMNYY